MTKKKIFLYAQLFCIMSLFAPGSCEVGMQNSQTLKAPEHQEILFFIQKQIGKPETHENPAPFLKNVISFLHQMDSQVEKIKFCFQTQLSGKSKNVLELLVHQIMILDMLTLSSPDSFHNKHRRFKGLINNFSREKFVFATLAVSDSDREKICSLMIEFVESVQSERLEFYAGIGEGTDKIIEDLKGDNKGDMHIINTFKHSNAHSILKLCILGIEKLRPKISPYLKTLMIVKKDREKLWAFLEYILGNAAGQHIVLTKGYDESTVEEAKQIWKNCIKDLIPEYEQRQEIYNLILDFWGNASREKTRVLSHIKEYAGYALGLIEPAKDSVVMTKEPVPEQDKTEPPQPEEPDPEVGKGSSSPGVPTKEEQESEPAEVVEADDACEREYFESDEEEVFPIHPNMRDDMYKKIPQKDIQIPGRETDLGTAGGYDSDEDGPNYHPLLKAPLSTGP